MKYTLRVTRTLTPFPSRLFIHEEYYGPSVPLSRIHSSGRKWLSDPGDKYEIFETTQTRVAVYESPKPEPQPQPKKLTP